MVWLIAGAVVLLVGICVGLRWLRIDPAESDVCNREVAACLARLKSEVTAADLCSLEARAAGRETRALAVTSQGVSIAYSLRREVFTYLHTIELSAEANRVVFAAERLVYWVLGVRDTVCGGGGGPSGPRVELRMNEPRQQAYLRSGPRVPAPSEEIDWEAILEANDWPIPVLPPAPAVLSRAELQLRLQRLVDEAVDEPDQDAEIDGILTDDPPDRAEYACPICGTRTPFGKGLAQTVALDIPAARAMISQIGGVSVELDESQFCKSCRPEIEQPQLGAVITAKGEPPRRVEPVRAEDLHLLEVFVRDGCLLASPFAPERQKSIARLAEFFGLETR